MLVNNNERLNIWLRLNNKFDYLEFVGECKKINVEPLSVAQFAQKAGLLTCASITYPEEELSVAYLHLLDDSQVSTTIDVINLNPVTKNNSCGGCGGGKVL